MSSEISKQIAKRKAEAKDAFEKERKRIVEEIRRRRSLISQGEADYNGKNNRKEIVNLKEELERLEAQTSRKMDALDAEKHKMQIEDQKKHKWSF